MKKLILIAFIPILLFSCKKRVYHSFTDDERAFLVYDAGEEFKLKNENSGEVITLKVTNRSLIYVEDFGPKLGPSRKEHYMEQGRIDFSDKLGNYKGYIYIYKDKIDQLSITPSIDSPTYGFSGDGTLGSKETTVVNGVTYNDVYVFNSIYFSKTHGFVKLENSTNHYTIVP